MLERGFADGKAGIPVRGECWRHSWRAADDSIERDIFLGRRYSEGKVESVGIKCYVNEFLADLIIDQPLVIWFRMTLLVDQVPVTRVSELLRDHPEIFRYYILFDILTLNVYVLENVPKLLFTNHFS